MSFRDQMRVRVSRLEMDLLTKEFRKRGLINRGFHTQYEITLKKTVPDFAWLDPRKCVFVDGEQVHPEGAPWDEEVIDLLAKIHWEGERFRYHAPASIDERIRVADEIQEFIGEI